MKSTLLILSVLCSFTAVAAIPAYLSPKASIAANDVVVPMFPNDPVEAAAGQLYFNIAEGKFKGIDNVGTSKQFLTSSDVGTSAYKIVQLDGSGRLPAVDGSQLTNLPGGDSANTSLSNLSGVAVNSHLLPDSTDNFRMLGDNTHLWNVMVSRQAKVMLYTIRSTETGETNYTTLRGDSGYTPSGSLVGTFMEHGGPRDLGFFTWSDSNNNSNSTRSILIETGNKEAGTGNSGNIQFYLGTSVGGTRGQFKIADGSEGTIGDVWTSTGADGAGHWSAPKSPAGTVCGWNDGTLILDCQGVDPSSACPTGYTQRTTATGADFCSAD